MSDSKSTCLVVIYNHNYERNIPIIDRIYSNRFSTIYHVLPFYRGSDSHIIGVYENSFQFSGYLAQSLQKIINPRFKRYVFVADDLCLTPTLNENTINQILNINDEIGFHPILTRIDLKNLIQWPFGMPSYMHLLSEGNACEWRKFLPSKEQACELLKRHEIQCDFQVSEQQFTFLRRLLRPLFGTPYTYTWIPLFGNLKGLARFLPSKRLVYPLLHGFSDFFVVPGSSIEDFAHYCGVFAAIRVFTESAIPMSMLFCCKKVRTLKDINMTGITGNGGATDRITCLKDFKFDYGLLQEKFPSKCLYVHPVKLSQWKNLP